MSTPSRTVADQTPTEMGGRLSVLALQRAEWASFRSVVDGLLG